MNRSLGARRLRNLDDEQRASVELDPAHVVAAQQVGAHLLRVLEKIPEVTLDLVDIGDAVQLERAVREFLGAEDNDTTLGVGHRAVSLPERLWEGALAVATGGELGLEVPAFAEGIEIVRGHVALSV